MVIQPTLDSGTSSKQASSAEGRRLKIDTLRGLAIVLVVALHATGSFDQPRLSTVGSVYEYFGFSLNSIRLPLFTVLSGLVYGLRPVRAETLRRFASGKVRRLALPLITITLVTFSLRAVVGSGPSGAWELLRAFVMPYEHLWYLPALGWIFAVVVSLDLRHRLDAPTQWARLLAAAVVLHLVTDAIGWAGLKTLSLAGAIYLLPSFLLGVGLARFSKLLSQPTIVVTAASVAAVGLAVQQLVFFEVFTVDVSKTGLLSIAVGLSSCLVLLQVMRPAPLLARLGQHSYPIYLLHGIGIAVGTRLADVMVLESSHTLFLTHLACGLILPLIGEQWIRRIPAGQMFVLGERLPATPKEAPQATTLLHKAASSLSQLRLNPVSNLSNSQLQLDPVSSLSNSQLQLDPVSSLSNSQLRLNPVSSRSNSRLRRLPAESS